MQDNQAIFGYKIENKKPIAKPSDLSLTGKVRFENNKKKRVIL